MTESNLFSAFSLNDKIFRNRIILFQCVSIKQIMVL